MRIMSIIHGQDKLFRLDELTPLWHVYTITNRRERKMQLPISFGHYDYQRDAMPPICRAHIKLRQSLHVRLKWIHNTHRRGRSRSRDLPLCSAVLILADWKHFVKPWDEIPACIDQRLSYQGRGLASSSYSRLINVLLNCSNSSSIPKSFTRCARHTCARCLRREGWLIFAIGRSPLHEEVPPQFAWAQNRHKSAANFACDRSLQHYHYITRMTARSNTPYPTAS